MELSKKEFLSAVEPLCGKFCMVVVRSPKMNFDLWMFLESLSDTLLIKFSKPSGESLTVDLSGAVTFERDGNSLAPLDSRKRFDRAFELGFIVKAEGDISLAMLFSKDI
jgi:hypothetical protein